MGLYEGSGLITTDGISVIAIADEDDARVVSVSLRCREKGQNKEREVKAALHGMLDNGMHKVDEPLSFGKGSVVVSSFVKRMCAVFEVEIPER